VTVERVGGAPGPKHHRAIDLQAPPAYNQIYGAKIR